MEDATTFKRHGSGAVKLLESDWAVSKEVKNKARWVFCSILYYFWHFFFTFSVVGVQPGTLTSSKTISLSTKNFFSLYVFGEPAVHFRNFFLCCPSQRSARSQVPSLGGNPPGDWQSAVGWGDAGFEPGTAGQQPGAQRKIAWHMAGETCYRWQKSAAQSTRIASFWPLAITSCPFRHLEFFYLKDEAPTGAGACTDLHKRSVLRKAFSHELAANDITS